MLILIHQNHLEDVPTNVNIKNKYKERHHESASEFRRGHTSKTTGVSVSNACARQLHNFSKGKQSF